MIEGKKEKDRKYIEQALRIAASGLGSTGSNPSVGAVIVAENGEIVGEGRTANGGRPHAEIVALRLAGDRARGSSLYVTLEPCCFEGKSGACTKKIMIAGVRKVIVLHRDVDKRVCGKGINSLRDAGVSVRNLEEEQGFSDLVQDGKRLNAGYILHRTVRRPLVALKLATSLDGKTGIVGKGNVWLTGKNARQDVHNLRKQYGGILVGYKTILADNPMLDTRYSTDEKETSHEPMPIVIDRDLKIAEKKDLNIYKKVEKRGLLVFAAEDVKESNVHALKERGAWVRRLDINRRGKFSWREILENLAIEGEISRLLVEGGSGVHTDMLTADVVDRFYWYRGACLVGDMQGISSWQGGLDAVERLRVRFRKHFDNVADQSSSDSDDLIVLEKSDFDARLCLRF